ncbi:MAG: hypothetical protein LBK59_07130 [Bifidobacteriaceae bacterium]|nr:hypothetical protein [Bifidobacteriaceae bacterium]
MRSSKKFRAGVGLFAGSLLLLAGAAAAQADETQYGEEGVEVTVGIKQLPGLLTLTVASNATALTEGTSVDPLLREFTGVLPTVRVTDTRDPADIADDAMWYVLGSATDFAGDFGQPNIPVDNFGWEPALTGPNDGNGVVTEGGPVGTALDSTAGPGLVDQELLYTTTDPSETIVAEEYWMATADLVLKTDITVDPGVYTSTLTLSLFE